MDGCKQTVETWQAMMEEFVSIMMS